MTLAEEMNKEANRSVAPSESWKLSDIEKLIFNVSASNFSGQINIASALHAILPFANKQVEEFLLDSPELYCGGRIVKGGGKAYLFKAVSKNILEDGVYEVWLEYEKIVIHKYIISDRYKKLPIREFFGIGMTNGRTEVLL